jgi:hypothetical protein
MNLAETGCLPSPALPTSGEGALLPHTVGEAGRGRFNRFVSNLPSPQVGRGFCQAASSSPASREGALLPHTVGEAGMSFKWAGFYPGALLPHTVGEAGRGRFNRFVSNRFVSHQ